MCHVTFWKVNITIQIITVKYEINFSITLLSLWANKALKEGKKTVIQENECCFHLHLCHYRLCGKVGAGSCLTCEGPYCCCCCSVASAVSDSVRPHRRQPTRLPRPWDLQARTLEWVAISFSSAWQWSRSVMSDSLQPHGLQPTGSSVHGIFQARALEWGAIAFSGEGL